VWILKVYDTEIRKIQIPNLANVMFQKHHAWSVRKLRRNFRSPPPSLTSLNMKLSRRRSFILELFQGCDCCLATSSSLLLSSVLPCSLPLPLPLHLPLPLPLLRQPMGNWLISWHRQLGILKGKVESLATSTKANNAWVPKSSDK